MQPEQEEHQQERRKDLHAAMLGQRGGPKRMAQLSPQQRTELARRAAFAKHHPYQFQQQRERGEEIARAVKQAIDDYLPSNKRNSLEP